MNLCVRPRSWWARLAARQAPPEVALRVRVALSQEMANARRPRWESLVVRWQNAFNAIMVPATAGLVTTIIIFGLLISFLYYPGQLSAANDVPTAFLHAAGAAVRAV